MNPKNLGSDLRIVNLVLNGRRLATGDEGWGIHRVGSRKVVVNADDYSTAFIT